MLNCFVHCCFYVLVKAVFWYMWMLKSVIIWKKIYFILNKKSIFMYMYLISLWQYILCFLHKFFLNTFYNYIYCSHSTVYQWETVSVTCTLNGVTIDSYLNVLVVTSHTQKQTQPSPPVDMRTRDSPRAWGQNCRQTITTKCMHRTDKSVIYIQCNIKNTNVPIYHR